MSGSDAVSAQRKPSQAEVNICAVDSRGHALLYEAARKVWLNKADQTVSPEKPARVTLFIAGDWLENRKRPQLEKLLLPSGLMTLSVDCSGITSWDSSVLIYLRRLQRQCNARNIAWEPIGLPDGMRRLLEIGGAGAAPDVSEQSPPREGFLHRVGTFTWEVLETIGQILSFTGELTQTLGRFFTGRARFQWRDVNAQLASAGPAALGIISLIGFLMGLILAFIGAIPLQMFAAESYVASLIGIGILRLMAPVMVGVVMAGRTGAAYAAELGTMQTNEEIDAFLTLGIPPMDFLVLPRCLALTLMMPFLCLFADLLGVLGGLLVATCYLDITWLDYYQTLLRTTRMADLLVGLFSSIVFGVLVAACGCYQGIYCGRTAESVGKAATDAVVNSIICIVLATATITIVTVIIRL
ncbi:MAG: hypothetical protein GX927_13745 [Lentisphaerae bacterium]|jgi:phospholipid/cholesterol/gamma-HCH transport system permease protein|nr:hypothetical protein [Lentisphaerota bacterium]